MCVHLKGSSMLVVKTFECCTTSAVKKVVELGPNAVENLCFFYGTLNGRSLRIRDER